MAFLSKCLEQHQLCVLYKQEKKGEKTNLSVFELESKCDNWEPDDEKLFGNPVIQQKPCPLKHWVH